ncbi:MAG: sigma-70 family RNA polymerase sigma factor [Candidatus Riflebacteria bacterium]|nr:sigma-70 family RNA polymerase sigma factor [Candidatus Riflebacteria bacterium]
MAFMDRESLLNLVGRALLEDRQILLSQLNTMLPLDLGADDLEYVFTVLDEEGISIVDDQVVLKKVRPEVRVELTDEPEAEPPPLAPEDEELTSNQRWYRREITKIPRLSPKEEVDLGRLAHTGDPKAAATLVQANLRLVVSMAKRYVHSGVNLMDLIQAGNEGLMEASTRYDPRKGERFGSFAKWWIRQAIVRAISASWHSIRIPKALSRECQRVIQARDVLKRRFGRSPSAREVAEFTEFPLEHVEFLDSLIQVPTSLDAPIPGMDGVVLENIIPDEKAQEPMQESVRQTVKRILKEVFDRLDLVERRVVALRYGLDDKIEKSVDEVARLTGMNREKVRQIERHAIGKLRTLSRDMKLDGVLRSAAEPMDDD